MDRNSLYSRIESAGKLRDGLIVIVTLIYITGYAAWSYIAWHNGFGALPVLDAQYFLAGFPPFLTTVLMIIVIRFLRSFLLFKWPGWLQRLSIKKQVIVHISIFLLPICSIALLLLNDLLNWPSKDQGKIISIISILSFLTLFSLLFEPKLLIDTVFEWVNKKVTLPEKSKSMTFFRQILDYSLSQLSKDKLSKIYVLPILAGIVAISLYLNVVYPEIPYEFGGGKPRVARLDLLRSDFSEESIGKLVDSNLVMNKGNVLSSTSVTVFLATKDFLLVKRREPENSLKDTLEIPRNSVKAINWIDK